MVISAGMMAGVEQSADEPVDLLVLVVERVGPERGEAVGVGAVDDDLGADCGGGGGHTRHGRAEH